MSVRALFLIKQGQAYGQCGPYHQSSGLLNSVTFVSDMLRANGIHSKVVQVIDNNDIDREVHLYRPTHVFIEALWVVPEKFMVLRRLHPGVKWIVHLHSDIPFLATEGIAIDWIERYLVQENVYIAFNTLRAEAFGELLDVVDGFRRFRKILYLPNFYPLTRQHKHCELRPRSPVVEIGCFGAIRPLKNQLVQAVAALRFAEHERKTLRFHVNATRCEDNGSAILRNLRALFDGTSHQLIEHGWLEHREFVDLMEDMDVAMSVSFSETFCITAADAVQASVPLVCSAEIPWASHHSIVSSTTDSQVIAAKLLSLSRDKKNLMLSANRNNLQHYAQQSEKLWLDYLRGKA